MIESKDGLILKVDEIKFHQSKTLLNSFEFVANLEIIDTPAIIQLVPGNRTVTLKMYSSFEISKNPIERIKLLLVAARTKSTYDKILKSLSNYFSTVSSLYDIEITETTVAFEYVATTSKILSHYPSVSETYSMVDLVREYIKKKDGKEKGNPMMFSTLMRTNEYFTQVAIPIERQLDSTLLVKSKWLLKGGQILYAEVKGGKSLVANAFKQMEFYIQDNQHSKVAMPYEYLITNRAEQPDSSKWVTGVYYPVIIKNPGGNSSK